MVLWILSTQHQNIIPYIGTAKEYFIKRFSSYKDVSKINRTCYYARYMNNNDISKLTCIWPTNPVHSRSTLRSVQAMWRLAWFF